MSSLTSASSLADVEAAYVDNASYAEDASAAKAKAFITACRILLVKIPKESRTSQSSSVFNTDLIQKEMEAARDWVASVDPGSVGNGGINVSRMSFENFR